MIHSKYTDIRRVKQKLKNSESVLNRGPATVKAASLPPFIQKTADTYKDIARISSEMISKGYEPSFIVPIAAGGFVIIGKLTI